MSEEMTPLIWEFLIERKNLKNQHKRINYGQIKNLDSDYEELIKRDLPTEVPHFLGNIDDFRNMLFNILKVYSVVNKKVNYCTGMNLIASAILFNLIP